MVLSNPALAPLSCIREHMVHLFVQNISMRDIHSHEIRMLTPNFSAIPKYEFTKLPLSSFKKDGWN